MSFLSSLIKPEIAINMIRKQLEKHSGKKVEKFSVMFFSEKDELQFFLPEQQFFLKEKMLRQLILSKVNDLFKEGECLEMVKIDCEKNTIIANVYYRDKENVKKYITYTF